MENNELGKTKIGDLLEQMLESDSILEAMRKERLQSKKTESDLIHERKEILKKLRSKN